jgi:hypothetical protein
MFPISANYDQFASATRGTHRNLNDVLGGPAATIHSAVAD